MAKQFRFTGRLPTRSALEQFSNWTDALDEEGESGQDESTIKPEAQQTVISDRTLHTVADAYTADGERQIALLSDSFGDLWSGELETLNVYFGNRPWEIVPDGERWSFAAEPPSGKLLRQRLPMRISSRLPAADGEPIAFTLEADGRLVRSEGGARTQVSSPYPHPPEDISVGYRLGDPLPPRYLPDGRASEESKARWKASIHEQGIIYIELWRCPRGSEREFLKARGLATPHPGFREVFRHPLRPLLEHADYVRLYNSDSRSPYT